MKIEMGESLFYSWLRHVKECQIVQTNWKTSPQWTLLHEEKLEEVKAHTDRYFRDRHGYDIYKKTSSLSQLLQQAECDALGMSILDGSTKVFAVDVAFHEAGVNYGDRETTIKKIIAKCLRTAMCIYGYLDTREAEIIFASPKINNNILDAVMPCLVEAQKLLDDLGFHFRLRIIANEDFRDKVLEPILLVSDGVADTNELFLRSYQMLQMFDRKERSANNTRKSQGGSKLQETNTTTPAELSDDDTYAELKIGKLAQTVLRRLLQSEAVSEDEIEQMQTADYSKTVFDLQYPLLVKQDEEYERVRYYRNPVCIRGINYMLCSQWFEVPSNNDRPYLMRWIREHQTSFPTTQNTTSPGYINANNQRNNGKTDKPGTDNNQFLYEMECLNCGRKYYANGSDIWQRKCPSCQGGKT